MALTSENPRWVFSLVSAMIGEKSLVRAVPAQYWSYWKTLI